MGSYDREPVENPAFRAMIAPNGRTLLLTVRRNWADEGLYGQAVEAFVCDQTARTCQ
jgi:hypothetical protein